MPERKNDLRRRIKTVLSNDRDRLLRQLERLEYHEMRGRNDAAIAEKRRAFERRVTRAEEKKTRRLKERPRVVYGGDLPILAQRKTIIDAIRRHRIIVVTGETGSGKTTQLPKMCLEAGRGVHGLIGCTQPRRIAAVSVASRVAEELGEHVGQSVGYKIRFENKTGPRGYVKFMTDGILLMETQSDPLLRSYDTLIIDEAHERSINIDFILGFLKKLAAQRNDLKIIITSATIDPEKFSRAFDGAPVIEVSGRTWPVEIRYRPADPSESDEASSPHIEAVLAAVKELKERREGGNILVFMPTEQDIRETCESLEDRRYRNTLVLPLYARLPAARQRLIFQSTREDKIIVATNVAETSITVPGIRYVIDTGLARIAEYRPQSRTVGLPVKAVAKSSVIQRTGRAGRLARGICIRLYSEEDFEKRSDFTPPEILRTNLAEIILRMLHLNLGEIASFPFIDKPRPRTIRDGYDILLELGAITRGNGGYLLTEQGHHMAVMPLDPRISRIVLEAAEENCLNEILVIAAALSVQDPRERPPDMEQEAERAQKAFVNPASDFITLLNIWNAFHRSSSGKSGKGKRSFCRKHFLSFRRMKEWSSVRDELAAILDESGLPPEASGSGNLVGEQLYEAIHKSIIAGYLSQVAVKKEKNMYHFAKGREAMLFPGSGLFNGGAAWIVSAEIVETSRLFARMNGMIKSEWLEEVAGSFCRKSWSEPRWDPLRGEVVATEQVSLFGLVIVAGRTVSYGPVNAEEASEIFVKQALLEEGITSLPPFLKHNRVLIDRVETMENKIRKRTILVDEEDMVRFYRERLGPVYDVRTLKKIIRQKGSDEFLRMREEDLRRWLPAEELERYPDQVDVGGERFSLTYRFEPGSAKDGVTLNIPSRLLHAVAGRSPDMKIPGLLREKIHALLKRLPKEYRRHLIPVGTAADQLADLLNSETAGDDTSFLQALSSALIERFGIVVPAAAWPIDSLPAHLAVRYALVDGKKNRELKASRNISDLVSNSADHAIDENFERAVRTGEQGPFNTWDFEDLFRWIDIPLKQKKTIRVYPALSEEGSAVYVRFYRTEEEALFKHADGIRRLYELHFAKDRKYLLQCLRLPDDLRQSIPWPGGAKAFEDMLARVAVRRLVPGTIRQREEFLRRAAQARPLIFETAREIMATVEPVVGLYIEIRRRLLDMKETNRGNVGVSAFTDLLKNHLDRLVPPDFPARFDENRLSRLPVYLRGLSIRAERGIAHLEKDKAKADKAAPFENALEKIRQSLPPFSSEQKRRSLDEFAWMIEEYRLSLFAPELKTAETISSRRLEKRLTEITAMV